MKKLLFFTILFFLINSVNTLAQDSININGNRFDFIPAFADTVINNGHTYIIKYVQKPEMAYFMRSNGKIYVVIMVLATIFAGIFAYLIFLDRKIGKIEKEK
jgi:CcmD family protein